MTIFSKYFTKIFFFSKFLPFQQIYWAIFVKNVVLARPTPRGIFILLVVLTTHQHGHKANSKSFLRVSQ